MKKWFEVWVIHAFIMVFALTGFVGYSSIEASANSPQKEEYKQVLDKTIDLAKQGYVINTEKEKIKLGSTGAEVKEKFGEPDFKDSPTYYVYNKKRLQFNLDETEGTPDNKRPVVTITTTDQRYYEITYKQVQEALKGYKKLSESKGEDGVYVTYQVDSNFLEFVFYYDDKGENPFTIKEVNVQDQE